MTRLILTLVSLASFSCAEDDITEQYDIYNQWRWDETTLTPHGTPYQTSQELDTTYYYNFLKTGVLQEKDVNKVIKSELKYEVVDNEIIITDSFGNEWPYWYSIEKGKLRLTNVYGFIAYTLVFKIDNKPI